jgi:hypothetical protein
MANPNIRDERADVRNAYIREYEGYRAAGRDEDADAIAGRLRDEFDHDVTAGQSSKATKAAKVTPDLETAAAQPPLENAAAPRGDQATRVTPPAADDGEDDEVEGLRHVGGGTYELSNGERVKGRDAAEARQRELNQGAA